MQPASPVHQTCSNSTDENLDLLALLAIFPDSLPCICRDSHQHELSKLQSKVKQAAATGREAEEALQVVKQELSGCQAELATVQQDLTQWPDAW